MKYIHSLILFGLTISIYGQTDTIYWQKKSPLPSYPVAGFGYFVIDSNFYVVAGEDSNQYNHNEVWRYNIPTDQWQQMSNFPEPTQVSACFTINGKGYVLTGRDSINNYECDSAFFEYDPASDTWTRKANLSDSHRQNAVGFSYGGTGYVGFGGGCGANYNDLWKYDTGSNQWTQMGYLPSADATGRSGPHLVIADTFAYLTGGDNPFGLFNDFWRYDIHSNHWDSIGTLPGLGRNLPLFWSFDSVLLGGGGGLVDTSGFVYMSKDYYRYDVKQNMWDTVQFLNFMDSTEDGACFVIGNTGYFFGGFKSLIPTLTLSTDMFTFDATAILPHDSTTVGIRNVNNDGYNFKLYPNPVHAEQNFQIATSAAGQISFYNSLGQVLFTTNLNVGMNKFNAAELNDAADVVFYKATMKNGSAENGRMVVIR